jgi:hypothetical protein
MNHWTRHHRPAREWFYSLATQATHRQCAPNFLRGPSWMRGGGSISCHVPLHADVVNHKVEHSP